MSTSAHMYDTAGSITAGSPSGVARMFCIRKSPWVRHAGCAIGSCQDVLHPEVTMGQTCRLRRQHIRQALAEPLQGSPVCGVEFCLHPWFRQPAERRAQGRFGWRVGVMQARLRWPSHMAACELRRECSLISPCGYLTQYTLSPATGGGGMEALASPVPPRPALAVSSGRRALRPPAAAKEPGRR
jgi:hypothetical protein